MKLILLVLTVTLFCVSAKQSGGFGLEGVSQKDIEDAKAMFIPMIADELKHVELTNV